MQSSREIRQSFFDFFNSKDHKIVNSASVIPYDDPTLLFTNAGMNQFKDVFLGLGKRDYLRCANTQKCIRVSGKHNDLEEVGHDGYHHTFFEMLGNWSFGDYYKKEAIKWAWELLTVVWKLPKDRLWATVFKTDNEAFKLWKTETDIDENHILKFDEKDNFWEMGETGPCGPCSEIHVDLTENGCKAEDVNAGNPDVIEIWNLVFIQYNRDDKGVLHELPKKHIDTGMGFERIVRVLQNKDSNYDTDVFTPLINEIIDITKQDYTGNFIIPMNVIADHSRTLTFAIADGAIPSNEGRGYVLRRILRRAARYGRKLNLREPFIYKLTDVLVKEMGSIFKELKEKKDFIKEVIRNEEISFNETLDRGLVYFNEEVNKLKKENKTTFSGEAAFKLHDTYGFPIDLTQLLARENNMDVDMNEFTRSMNIQKERSRASRKETNLFTENIGDIFSDVSYDPYHVNSEGKRTRLIIPDNKEPAINEIIPIYIKDNPFYSESGGQVSDKGIIILEGGKEFEVVDSKKNYVLAKKLNFNIAPGEYECLVKVDLDRRKNIEKNHTATHIVHEALRRVLGTHVRQMGSYLDDTVLRFDFPHFSKLSNEQINEIENIVNNKISEKIDIFDEVMPIEKADKIPNVKKFFGEKYGDIVRVVYVDPSFSVEFCGGTHVLKTSDIGLFKIIKEESISSGVRRIFARTGNGIIKYMNDRINEIESLLNTIPQKYSGDLRAASNELKNNIDKADPSDSSKIRKLLAAQEQSFASLYELRERYFEEKKVIEKQEAKQKAGNVLKEIDEIEKDIDIINDKKVLIKEFNTDSIDLLKDVSDKLRLKYNDMAGFLYFIKDEKINLVIFLGDVLIKKHELNSGNIVKQVAKIMNGGGGGKAHLATAGAKDISKLEQAKAEFKKILSK